MEARRAKGELRVRSIVAAVGSENDSAACAGINAFGRFRLLMEGLAVLFRIRLKYKGSACSLCPWMAASLLRPSAAVAAACVGPAVSPCE